MSLVSKPNNINLEIRVVTYVLIKHVKISKYKNYVFNSNNNNNKLIFKMLDATKWTFSCSINHML
jgi:hypothetical protein